MLTTLHSDAAPSSSDTVATASVALAVADVASGSSLVGDSSVEAQRDYVSAGQAEAFSFTATGPLHGNQYELDPALEAERSS